MEVIKICTESLTVIKTIKSKNNFLFKESFKEPQVYRIMEFKAIYHDKNSQKIFLYIGSRLPALVFDVRNENFYFVSTPFKEHCQKDGAYYKSRYNFTWDTKGNVYYLHLAYKLQNSPDATKSYYSEIKTLTFADDMFTEGELKMKVPEETSICFI